MVLLLRRCAAAFLLSLSPQNARLVDRAADANVRRTHLVVAES